MLSFLKNKYLEEFNVWMVTKDFKVFFSSSDLTRLISVFVLIMMKRIYITLNITHTKKKQVRLRGTMGLEFYLFFKGVMEKSKVCNDFSR